MNLRLLIVPILGVALTASLDAQDTGLPANPEPGKCYIKCVTPDVFEDVTEEVMVKPGYSVLTTTEAVYETVYDTVLVKEASKRFEFVEAVYETVEVDYIEKEKRTDLAVIPASFNDDEETFEVYPKVERWEYSVLEDCPYPDKQDCQTLCWQEYPAQYRTVPTVVLASDASTDDVPIPEEPATYTKQVIKEPARVVEIDIPAEYDVIARQVLVTPSKTIVETIDPVYETVTRTVLKEKGGLTVWEEIDCELTNFTVLPILYDLNSAALTPAARRTIDETLLSMMKEKPNISVEIASHTDSRGDDDYNMALSERRAQSVVNYLTSKGISSSRLIARGYGETRLKNRCSNGVDCSEEEHHQNRRTEFRVIGN